MYLTSSKFKTACIKEPKSRKQKEPIEWETIFANHVFSKGLASRIHKELTQQ